MPVRLPDGRVWLRVADPDWTDPLDPSWAADRGGRWNPPASHPTLYLNADVGTAQSRIEQLLAGSPVNPDDLDDDAYVLVAATLPRSQTCADAVSPVGLRSLELPSGYPLDAAGAIVAAEVCQRVGQQVYDAGLRGVWCRSAATRDGRGRELAWFPAAPQSRAKQIWRSGLPYGEWRYAAGWSDLGLEDQRDPVDPD